MNNCLNCGKPVEVVEGRRKRKFCDNNNKCKGEYNRKLNKQQKYVHLKSFKELQAKYELSLSEIEVLKGKVSEKEAQLDKMVADAKNNGVKSVSITYDRTDPKPLQEGNKELNEIIGGESDIDKPFDPNIKLTRVEYGKLTWQNQAAYRAKHKNSFK